MLSDLRKYAPDQLMTLSISTKSSTEKVGSLMIRFMFIACLIGFLTGCAQKAPQFIVYRDVPESPSFVVIPANDYLHEVYFANEIEEAIISCGVKVEKRPSTRRIRTEKSIGGLEGNRVRAPDAAATSVREADAKRVETYSVYGNMNADYMVETYGAERQVKISKRDTREVLAIFYAIRYKKGRVWFTWRHKVHETLKLMGIKVRNPFPEKPGSKSRRSGS